MKTVILDTLAFSSGIDHGAPTMLRELLQALEAESSGRDIKLTVLLLAGEGYEPQPLTDDTRNDDCHASPQLLRLCGPDELTLERLDETLSPMEKRWRLRDVLLVSADETWLCRARELELLTLSVVPGSNNDIDLPRRAITAFANPARAVDPIRGLIDRVSPEELNKSVSELVEFGTRDAHQPVTLDVQEYLTRRFRCIQNADGRLTQCQEFTFTPKAECLKPPLQRNIFLGPNLDTLHCSKRGLILICAHYDSVSKNSCVSEDDEDATLAPGANDNATGVAALLELARLCPGPDESQADVLFAAFAAEEPGRCGSIEAARAAVSQKWPIKLVVNMDMIGHNPIGRGNQIRVRYENFRSSRRDTVVSRAGAHLLAQTAEEYTELRPWLSDFSPDSDHWSFWQKDYAAIKVEEFNKDLDTNHTVRDLPSTVDYEYLSSVTKMILAFTLKLITKR